MKRVLATTLLVTTAVGAVAGAQTLLWCPSMERVLERCCCPARESAAMDHASIERAPCCETRELSGALPGIFEQRAQGFVERSDSAIVLPAMPEVVWARRLHVPPPQEHTGRARVGPDIPIYTLQRSLLI